VDWLSRIPLPVRWLTTLGLLALAYFTARRFVLPTFRTRRVVDESALAVERRFPELADRVISAVQLDRRAGDPGYGSAELIAATQEQAAEWSQRVRFGQAEPLSRFLPLVVLGVLALAGAGWAAGTYPAIAGTWAVRCVWNADYPHVTTIVRYPKEMLVARGEPAEIEVQATGLLLPPGGKVKLTSPKSGSAVCDLSASGQRGRYLARVESVVEPLNFTIELGDAPPASGVIRVADRPEVAQVLAELTSPDYVGGRVERLNTGHLRALPGTAVKLTIQASKPLVAARLQFDDGRSMPMQNDEGSAWTAHFAIERDGGYTINLADADKLTNLAPVRYKIVAIEDAVPKVVLVRPGAEALATPVSRLKIQYKISDDFGLKRARLMFWVNADKDLLPESAKSFPLVLPGISASQPDADLAAPGPAKAELFMLWDLSLLGLNENDKITYRLVAEDHATRRSADGTTRHEVGASPDREIMIVNEAAIAKQLEEQWQAAVDQIERSYQLVEQSQERMRQIEREIGVTTQPEK
jgi:hypothetical protein